MKSRVTRALAGVWVTLLALGLAVGPAGADQDPPGCTDSRLTLTLGKDVDQVLLGDVVRYDLVMFTVPVGRPCDIELSEIRFLCPDANGVPANPQVIASNLQFESDGSTDRTYAHDTCSFGTEVGQPCDSSNPADAGTVACINGGGVCPDLECVITGFDGNMEALARAETDGIVHDSAADTTQADDSDELAVTVLSCELQVDKQVSCDGTNFHDVGLNPPDDGANGCISWNAYDSTGDGVNDMSAEPLDVNYVAKNVGTAVLSDCVLTDTNGAIIGQTNLGDINPTQDTSFPVPGFCSDGLDDLEPDTATVSCVCEVPNDPTPFQVPVEESDDATFECRTPDFTVSKNCQDPDVQTGEHPVTITVENIGATGLLNCVATDTAYPEDAVCDGDTGAQVDVPLAVTPFDLGFGGNTQLTGSVAPLADVFANNVSVTCEIDDGTGSPVLDPSTGQPKTITRTDCDTCTSTCEVQVDKQISCDGGNTWHDEGLVTSPDGTGDTCVGWNAFTAADGVPGEAEEILVRYAARNNGNIPVYACTLTESNDLIDTIVAGGNEIDVGGLDVNQTLDNLTFAQAPVCSEDLEAGEPDTATLVCGCVDVPDPDRTAQAQDDATFQCQTPEFTVSKNCQDPDVQTGLHPVVVTVENTGSARLINCQATDTAYPEDPTCEGDTGATVDVPLITQPFDLDALANTQLTGDVAPFADVFANNVSVTCQIDDGTGSPVLDDTGAPKTITRTDCDTCQSTCAVEVDKQVSCDGGNTWHDEGLVTSPDGTGDTCAGWNAFSAVDGGQPEGEEILVRYAARNAGNIPLYACTLGESNDLIDTIPAGGNEIDVGGLDVSQLVEDLTFAQAPVCSDDLAAGEPDTATVICGCVDEPDPDRTAQAQDDATFSCLTPEFTVVKNCEDPDVQTGLHPVTVTVENTGTARLINCQATDTAYPEDATCEGDTGSTVDVPLVTQPFDLNSLASTQLTGDVAPLADTFANNVSVTCQIDDGTGSPVLDETGTPKTITRTDCDTCTSTCEVQVDKQISCDGGNTWHDEGLVSSPDGTGDTCVGWNAFSPADGAQPEGEEILVRYSARNDGNIPVYACTLTESNDLIDTIVAGGNEIDIGGLDVNQTLDDLTFAQAPVCSEDLEAGEPDTATLVCGCVDVPDPDRTAEASDDATFSCQTPEFTVNKDCQDPDAQTGLHPVVVTVENTGSARLINCQATDTAYPEDATCEGDTGSTVDVPLVVQPFDLNALASTQLTGDVTPFADTFANNVVVTCEIDDGTGNPVLDPSTGQPKTITRADCDTCGSTCEVQVDKQISCDGGNTWHDEGLVTSPDGTGDTCVGWNAFTAADGGPGEAEEILVRYAAHNSGTIPVFACEITESNDLIDVIPAGGNVLDVGALGVGQTEDNLTFAQVPVCSADLAAGEPDTATLLCGCTDEPDPERTAEASDDATFSCQTPDLTIVKDCQDVDAGTGLHPIVIDVENTGDAPLINCEVTDGALTDHDSCDLPDVFRALAVPLSGTQPFDLVPAGTAQFTGDISPAADSFANTATVTCQIDDGTGSPVLDSQGIPKTISRLHCDLCESTCTVQVDKQISCDGGNTWIDVTGGDDANGNDVESCLGWSPGSITTPGGSVSTDAEPILVRYKATNTGTIPVFECKVTESNDAIDGAPGGNMLDVGDLGVGQMSPEISFLVEPPLCSAELDANEPDTATLDCLCEDDINTDRTAQATDTADFDCQAPGLEFSKDCEEFVAGGVNPVVITSENTGEAELVNCTVVDTLYRADPTCPPAGAGEDVTIVPDAFDLAVGGGPTVSEGGVSVVLDACNVATIECDVEGSFDPATGGPKKITATDDDVCVPPPCEVQVDKQISCDGGVTWFDAANPAGDPNFVTSDDDGHASLCVGWNAYTADDGTPVAAEDIRVRYAVKNTGQLDLFGCQGDDDNDFIGAVFAPVDIAVGATHDFTPLDVACTDDLGDNEPDTFSINCFCSEVPNPDNKVSAFDKANFDCQTPGLEVMKVCDEQADGVNQALITVRNTGEAGLEDCTITDLVYPDESSCPSSGVGGIPVATLPADIPFLASGDMVNVTADVEGLFQDSCNEVEVTCTIVGSGGKTLTSDNDDVCEVGEGCLTRTPGFWGTHPRITQKFLDIFSCGITISHTDSLSTTSDPGSSAEDMCFSNRDAKDDNVRTSPQQLQLIRQCTAAYLNFSASSAGGGSCENHIEGIADRIDFCCESLCTSGATGSEISQSGCIEDLDTFNNSGDTLEPFEDFIRPGPAEPLECRKSNGNGLVNPGRNLGPRK